MIPDETPIELGPQAALTTRDVEQIARRRRSVTLSQAGREAMARSHQLLDELIAQGARVYGVTTGYGPLATSHVVPERAATLQRNLVYHLATGVGPALQPAQARAVALARASSLSRGASALRPEVLERVLTALNRGLAPVIPALGSVGASGDLTPLAHLALALMGQGACWHGHDQRPSAEALAALDIEPLELRDREGLALVNGTSAMTGLAALNDVALGRALALAVPMTVLYAELLGGRLEAWDGRLGQVRPHPGQRRAHRALGAAAAGSARLIAPAPATIAREGADAEGVIPGQPLLQDPYTIRCAPQLLGAMWDVLDFHRQVVERELNAVTDNPIFDAQAGQAVHGGNFYGQHVSFVADALTNAAIKLMVWSERKIARLCDTTRNGELPPFLQARGAGLRSGLMGAQVTASALVAEARSRAQPASIQSVPTNADNQDVVSMGTIAAWRCAQIIERLWDVLAIEAIALAQGLELCGGLTDPDASGFAPGSVALAQRVRQHVDFLDEDRPLSPDIQALAQVLAAGE